MGSYEQVKVVRHEDEFVKLVGFASVSEERFEEEARPGLGAEKRAALPSLRRDEVGLRVVGGVLACEFQNLPSGAKALVFPDLFGTAEAVPLQNKFISTKNYTATLADKSR
jgi:hypothetical protein